jgi:hypothetical protein
MSEIRFRAVVGEDGSIRPPAGVNLPEGEVMVIVRSAVAAPTVAMPSSKEEDLASLRAFLLAAAAEAEAIDDDLPDDLAENHDHYVHGTPKR